VRAIVYVNESGVSPNAAIENLGLAHGNGGAMQIRDRYAGRQINRAELSVERTLRATNGAVVVLVPVGRKDFQRHSHPRTNLISGSQRRDDIRPQRFLWNRIAAQVTIHRAEIQNLSGRKINDLVSVKKFLEAQMLRGHFVDRGFGNS
jgi:hypothetical protein